MSPQTSPPSRQLGPVRALRPAGPPTRTTRLSYPPDSPCPQPHTIGQPHPTPSRPFTPPKPTAGPDRSYPTDRTSPTGTERVSTRRIGPGTPTAATSHQTNLANSPARVRCHPPAQHAQELYARPIGPVRACIGFVVDRQNRLRSAGRRAAI